MKIFRTYNIVTLESAEQGDTSEHGYVSESGYDHPIPNVNGPAFEAWLSAEVDAWEPDTDSESSVVEQVVEYLRDGGFTEPSSFPWTPGAWFSWADSQQDFYSGESRSESAHLEGFTAEQEREIASLLGLV